MSKTALFDAAKGWDAAAVRRLLARSPDLIGARDARGRTALHLCAGVAVAKRPTAVAPLITTARALVGAGADLDAVHRIADGGAVFPATPLWYALARGRNGRLAHHFLAAGADPDHCLSFLLACALGRGPVHRGHGPRRLRHLPRSGDRRVRLCPLWLVNPRRAQDSRRSAVRPRLPRLGSLRANADRWRRTSRRHGYRGGRLCVLCVHPAQPIPIRLRSSPTSR